MFIMRLHFQPRWLENVQHWGRAVSCRNCNINYFSENLDVSIIRNENWNPSAVYSDCSTLYEHNRFKIECVSFVNHVECCALLCRFPLKPCWAWYKHGYIYMDTNVIWTFYRQVAGLQHKGRIKSKLNRLMAVTVDQERLRTKLKYIRNVPSG